MIFPKILDCNESDNFSDSSLHGIFACVADALNLLYRASATFLIGWFLTRFVISPI